MSYSQAQPLSPDIVVAKVIAYFERAWNAVMASLEKRRFAGKS